MKSIVNERFIINLMLKKRARQIGQHKLPSYSFRLHLWNKYSIVFH